MLRWEAQRPDLSDRAFALEAIGAGDLSADSTILLLLAYGVTKTNPVVSPFLLIATLLVLTAQRPTL
jgi:hypothetical protein